MAYERRAFAGGAPETSIVGTLTATTLTIVIASATNQPTTTSGEAMFVIDEGNANEEKILVTRAGTTLTCASAAKRGIDGTTATTHEDQASIRHVHGGQDSDEANLVVSELLGQATAVGQIPVVDGVNSWAMVQSKTSGQLLIGNGTTLVSVAMSGDVTISSAGVTAIGASKVTAAMIAASVAGNGLAGGAGTALSVGAGAGLTASADAIDVVGGAGITANADDIAVNVDGSTIEINADTLRVKALGIAAAHIANDTITATQMAANAVGSSELADNAVDSPALQDGAVATAKIANAQVTALKIDAESTASQTDTWTSYTPTWTGGSPAIGNGVLEGKYRLLGSTLFLRIYMEAAGTTTFGSSTWAFSIPAGLTFDVTTPDTWTGSAHVVDAGTGDFNGICYNASGTTIHVNVAAGVNPSGAVSNTNPMAWSAANGDKLSLAMVCNVTGGI